MIKSIHLTNWRSHEDSRLEFSRGTNIIVGIMGSGKTSVMDALCFALFGNFPALQRRKLKLSDVIRSRPSQEDSASVELEFEINGGSYSLLRTINFEGKTEAEIRKDGRLLEGPQPKRVNELVGEALSLDYDLFTRAIYSEQNNIDYFLELPRGDRKKQIDQLLGIDRFEKARSELVKAINRLRDIMSDKQSLLQESDRARSEEELSRSKSESEKLGLELKSAESAIEGLRSKRKSLETKLNEQESRRAEHRKLSESRAGISHTLNSSCKRLGCSPGEIDEKNLLGQQESLEAKLKQSNGLLASLEKSISELQDEISSKKSRLMEIEGKEGRATSLRKELEQLLGGKKSEDLEAEITALAEQVNAKREEFASIRTKATDGITANKELEKSKGKCPICEAPLTQERKSEIIEKRGEEVRQLGKRLKSIENELEAKSSDLKKKQDVLSKASSIGAKLSEIKVENKGEISSSLSESKKKREQLGSELNAVKEAIPGLEESLRISKETRNVLSLAKQLSEVERKLAESKFNDEDYESTRGELENARISEHELKAKCEGISREQARVAQAIKLQGEKLAQINSLSGDIKQISSSLEQLSMFQNCVIETQRELREELIKVINSTMTDVWTSIYPYADYKAIRLSADEKGYDLEAEVTGRWVSVDGLASGGERATACLALRIAFAMVLAPNLKWLVLDEPTHNLDEEAVRSLSRAFYEKIPEIVEQTFVITHDENLKDAASGSLYRISRDKESAEPSRIERL